MNAIILKLKFFVLNFRIGKAKLLRLKLIHLFASELLFVKKLEVEKIKATFIQRMRFSMTSLFEHNIAQANQM